MVQAEVEEVGIVHLAAGLVAVVILVRLAE